MTNLTTSVIGCVFLATSILDAWKYHLNATKIKLAKTSKGHSRQFINIAIFNDVIRVMYGISVNDWYIILSSLFAMVFMCELFYRIYTYYPYKNRGQFGFKKPNIFYYLLNSILPNNIAKKL